MEQVEVSGITLDIDVLGKGPPLLYLRPEHYAHLHKPFVTQLAERWTVHMPRHPGFDGRPPPRDFRRVDDLAYLYLDLLDQFNLNGVTIVGSSFGGWVALEMAVRNCTRLKALGLIAPLGVKFGGRGDRAFADLSALPEEEAACCLFAGTPVDFSTFDSEQMTMVARDRQYLAYYAWKPYLHNPVLPRWLHRIELPTHLIWGESDGFVAPEHGKQLAERLPQARLNILPQAGHYPQIECLNETIAALCAGPCAIDAANAGA